MFKKLKGTSKASTSSSPPTNSEQWVNLAQEGKENRMGSLAAPVPKPWVAPPPNGSGSSRSQTPDRISSMESHATSIAFERMLDELQIPSTLRPKLSTLDTPVKAAMLKSSQVLNIDTPLSPPRTPSHLRKSRSSTSLDLSPRFNPSRSSTMNADGQLDNSFVAVSRPSSMVGLSSLDPNGDLPWLRSDAAASMATLAQSMPPPAGGYKPKDKVIKEKDNTPTNFAMMLANTTCTNLDIERLKKLRLMLRNESAGWSELFIRGGGYSALLSSLDNLLNVEWREEQRDDKILHELLRCFKALSTSSIGCFALRSSCPTPFNALMSLLYSDKKPGDLSSRQLIVDLLQILFELYPIPSSSTSSPYTRPIPQRGVSYSSSTTSLLSSVTAGLGRPSSPLTFGSAGRPFVASSPSGNYALPAPHSSVFALIRSLLLTPAPLPAEAPGVPISPHEFIESLHVPRIYKTYLQEISDVCRDYFWVFCHPNNVIWALAEVDESKVEKPKAPSGMTGGVEYEAAGYLTSHMRFINSLVASATSLKLPAQDEMSAYRLHSDLFASGFERILVTMRKASVAYYPTLHLEIARYVALATEAKYDMPWGVTRLVAVPPSSVLRSHSDRTRSALGHNMGSVSARLFQQSAPGQIPVPVLPGIERSVGGSLFQ